MTRDDQTKGSPGRGPEIRAASATDIGNIREKNQDDFLVVDGVLFVVADGMGGHVAGEVASRETIATMRASYPTPGLADDLRHAVRQANAAIWQRGLEDPSFRGMGTTVTAVAVLADASLAIANVGDSRTYLLREGQLQQLTRDHSFVQEAVRSGQLSRAQAEGHPRRSQLTRALGVSDDIPVDVNTIEPLTGDRFLLCSDGLWDEVGDELITMVMAGREDPAEVASELVRWAKDAGGRDNITVIVLDIVHGREEFLGGGLAPAGQATLLTEASDPGGSLMQPGSKVASNVPSSAPEFRRTRLVTWRVVLFLGVLLAVLAVVVVVVLLPDRVPGADFLEPSTSSSSTTSSTSSTTTVVTATTSVATATTSAVPDTTAATGTTAPGVLGG